MKGKVLHSFQAETIESKAQWFQSLPLTDRMELLCAYTDLIIQTNPKILEHKNAKPLKGRIQVLSKP